MKKLLTCLLALALLSVLAMPAMAQDVEIPEEVIAIYGGVSNPNRAKLKTMGQQSWYMLYSTQINAGEKIDLSTFKPCVQTETGLWKPGEAAIVPAFDPAAQEGQTIEYFGDWFAIRKDGFLAGDTGFSAALKYVCLYDGMYDILVSYSGGSSQGYAEEGYYQVNGDYIPASDGVYMSCWIKGEMMFCEDSFIKEGHRLPQTEVTYNGVDLKAGDEIYLVVDTKQNGGWDDPWWYLNIVRTGELPTE